MQLNYHPQRSLTVNWLTRLKKVEAVLISRPVRLPAAQMSCELPTGSLTLVALGASGDNASSVSGVGQPRHRRQKRGPPTYEGEIWCPRLNPTEGRLPEGVNLLLEIRLLPFGLGQRIDNLHAISQVLSLVFVPKFAQSINRVGRYA